MLDTLLIAIIILLTFALGVSIRYLWRFSGIIMVFEDDISDTLKALNDVEDIINNVLEMEIFFESPEVREEVNKILEEVKLCRMSINGMVERFTARSKQKYYFIDNQEEQDTFVEELVIPRLPGQPPNTPNPLEILQSEGMILDVRRQKK